MDRRQLLSWIGGAGIVLGSGTTTAEDDGANDRTYATADRHRSRTDEHRPDGIEIEIERIDGECLSDETSMYPTIGVHEDGLRIRAAIEAPTPCHEVALESVGVRDRPDDGGNRSDSVSENHDGRSDDEPPVDGNDAELEIRLTPMEPTVDACVQCIGAVHYELSIVCTDCERRPGGVRSQPGRIRLVHDVFDDPTTVFVLGWAVDGTTVR
ncbi:hypothetical protein ACLI4Y_15500 [Natrialbaceae archaeon A-CW3]